MAVRNISMKTSDLLSVQSQEAGKRRDTRRIDVEDIMLALVAFHPIATSRACELLDLPFHTMLFSLLPRMGQIKELRDSDTEPLPGGSGNKIMEDAMYCADKRGASVCTVGDVFYASMRFLLPQKFASGSSEFSKDESILVWKVAELYDERSLEAVEGNGHA